MRRGRELVFIPGVGGARILGHPRPEGPAGRALPDRRGDQTFRRSVSTRLSRANTPACKVTRTAKSWFALGIRSRIPTLTAAGLSRLHGRCKTVRRETVCYFGWRGLRTRTHARGIISGPDEAIEFLSAADSSQGLPWREITVPMFGQRYYVARPQTPSCRRRRSAKILNSF